MKVRALPVPGVWAHLGRIGHPAGSTVSVHVSAPADHEIEFVRLGLKAILDPEQSVDADRLDAEVLQRKRCGAAPQTIRPGSYIHVLGDPIPAGPFTLSLWLRPWKLPVIDVTQVAWHGLITDIDYPEAARFGLLLDHLGRIGAYAGDGRAFRHEWLHTSSATLRDRLGRWSHVAASFSENEVRIFLDGEEILVSRTEPVPDYGESSRLRIGAMAEGGEADDLLNGDIAQPFVGSVALTGEGAKRLFDDRGRSSPAELDIGDVLAFWPLDEENGALAVDGTGRGRDGVVVNHATWMVGGPSFDPADRKPLDYEPGQDRDRGHGIRFSSDDLVDTGWPVGTTFDIPEDAESGLYAVRICLAGQAPEHAYVAPLVVTRRKPRREGSVALLAATNTWRAYGLRPTNEAPIYGLNASFYSVHLSGRPHFHIGTGMPIPYAHPYGFESRRAARTRSTHLVRTERFMEAWLHREGYPYEMITDEDLTEAPHLLKDFAALAIVGHSEYWTDQARQGVIDFLEAGGNVLSLSGDTMTVRVTYDPTASVMECRKIVYDDDARWLGPAMWGESWHSDDREPGGSYRRLGKPSWDVLGMSFKGMIDDGTPTSFSGYRVLAPEHLLLNTPYRVDADERGLVGTRCLNGSGGASGYEFDANLDKTGMGPSPLPGITTLASAVDQHNIEWVGDPDHGADLIYWQRPAGGIVVNFGSIGAAAALPVDPAFANIVRNALARFGVERMTEAGPAPAGH